MARIDSPTIPADEDLTFEADCPASVEVLDWVFVTGPMVGLKYQVDTVDPDSPIRVPAQGIVINKPTSTIAVVQFRGRLKGLLSGLTPGKVLYVAADGKSSEDPVGTYDPPVGDVIDVDEFVLRAQFQVLPEPEYASHYNTTDGVGNCSVSTPGTASRRVSNPNGHFDIGGWAPGTTRDVTRDSPISYNISSPCSILDDSSTTFTAIVYGADGVTPIAQNPLTLTGNQVKVTDNITILVTSWAADYDKFKADIDVSINIAAILPTGGRFSVLISHVNGAEGTFSKTHSDVFLDQETNAAALSGVSIAETGGSVVTRFLSGVEYYDIGSDFTVGISDIDDLNDESYPTTQVNLEGDEYGLPAIDLEGGDLTGWNTDWDNANALYNKTNWAITQANLTLRTLLANIRARTKDWMDGSWVNSPNAGILIETHTAVSTRLLEPFYDEDWRCPLSADFDAANAKAGWDETADKGSGDALYYDGGVEHNKESWKAYAPDKTNQPDYTAHTGNQKVRIEKKHDGGASSGFSLSFSGTYTGLKYKLAKAWDGTPTGGTVWIDGEAAYNAALWQNGSPIGGSGGKVGTKQFTLGTNNVIYCADTLYIEFELADEERVEGPFTVVFS